MEQTKLNEEFVIDNTALLIIERLFWFLWFALFYIVIFISVANTDIERGISHSYSEFFINQAVNGRFLLLTLIFLIIAPLSTVYSMIKITKNDNNIYISKNGITYHESFIPIDNIDDIKIGCCPIKKSNAFIYFLVFVVGGIITIPLILMSLLSLYALKILKKSDISPMLHKYIIVTKNGKNILGLLLKQKEAEQLIAFKNKIENGEK